MERLIATFRPQAWVDDDAIDIDGRVTFDVTEKFLGMTLEELKGFAEHGENSDRLADDLPARLAHDGPFEVDVDPDD